MNNKYGRSDIQSHWELPLNHFDIYSTVVLIELLEMSFSVRNIHMKSSVIIFWDKNMHNVGWITEDVLSMYSQLGFYVSLIDFSNE